MFEMRDRRSSDAAELEDPEDQLAASAVSGHAPPAGPQWRRGLAPLPAAALGYDKPLCASLAGFTLHAATRAGALDPAGREKLLRYVLRPPIAYERIERRPEGWRPQGKFEPVRKLLAALPSLPIAV